MRKRFLFALGLLAILAGCGGSGSIGTPKYYPLSNPTLVMIGTPHTWDATLVHTLSVTEANRDGHRYWGYYTGYDGSDPNFDIGLAYSDDLVNWTKDPANPVVHSRRWASVVLINGVFEMVAEQAYSTKASSIDYLSSTDGKNFTDQGTIVQPVDGQSNQNPFLFYDGRQRLYRLYYFNRTGSHSTIYERDAPTMAELPTAAANVVLTADDPTIMAAPSVFYHHGAFWLATETVTGDKPNTIWAERMFVSSQPTSGFHEAADPLILTNDDACGFQYEFNNTLYFFYSERTSKAGAYGTWDLKAETYAFGS